MSRFSKTSRLSKTIPKTILEASEVEQLHSADLTTVLNFPTGPRSATGLAKKSCYYNCILADIDPVILTKSIPNAFEKFVRELPAELQLRRAGFILAHHSSKLSDSALSLIAISDEHTVRAGLGIAIPQEGSAVHEVYDSGCLKTINSAGKFHGNFVERHALVVTDEGCMGMYPLENDEFVFGVVTLNCANSDQSALSSGGIYAALGNFAKSITEVAPRAIA